MTRDEALAHSAALVAAVPDTPVSADLENGFADDPAGVAETVRLAIETGLAGCSIEDFARAPDDPIYDAGLAAERVAAAAEAAHAGPVHLVLTARAENLLHGRNDLADTIARLQAYQEAGADVLYAPGLQTLDDIRSVVSSVDRPVNVLALPNAPTIAELASVGVRRVSVGGAFAYVALGAVVEAARELREDGTYGFWKGAGAGLEGGAGGLRELNRCVGGRGSYQALAGVVAAGVALAATELIAALAAPHRPAPVGVGRQPGRSTSAPVRSRTSPSTCSAPTTRRRSSSAS